MTVRVTEWSAWTCTLFKSPAFLKPEAYSFENFADFARHKDDVVNLFSYRSITNVKNLESLNISQLNSKM